MMVGKLVDMLPLVKVAVICKSARLDCALDSFLRSRYRVELSVLSEVCNSSLTSKAVYVETGRTDDVEVVRKFALKIRPDFVFIGPEEPLAAGVVDMLREL